MVRKIHQNKSFTLIEVLVSISIIFLLSGITLLNFRPGQKNLALERAAEKLVQDLRRVQSLAAGEKAAYPGVFPPKYGIHFSTTNPTQYKIFADCDGSTELDENSECSEGNNELLETVNLEKGVKISQLMIWNISEESWDPHETLNVLFSPPFPTTEIYGGDTAEIILTLEDDQTKTKIICVDSPIGVIDVGECEL